MIATNLGQIVRVFIDSRIPTLTEIDEDRLLQVLKLYIGPAARAGRRKLEVALWWP
jgi:hypothetical protein